MLKWVPETRPGARNSTELHDKSENNNQSNMFEMEEFSNGNTRTANSLPFSRGSNNISTVVLCSAKGINKHNSQVLEDCIFCFGSETSTKCLQLREKIRKEERLRDGANKLLGIINDVKVRIRILGELDLINTKLQSLREQHSELATSFNDNSNENVAVPKSCNKMMMMMLVPSFKEMKTDNCFDNLKSFLKGHYYEDPVEFREEFYKLNLMRKKCLGPPVEQRGLQSLHEYFNQLYYVERRFFLEDPDANPVSFEWYDCFSGMISSQRTVSFEKGCLLFNIAVLYAKIAIREMKFGGSSEKWKNEIRSEYFLRSAGVFRLLRENFSNAPSCDLQWNCSEMLTDLMVLQQHEILVEDEFSTSINAEITDANALTRLAKCASFLSEKYLKISSKLSILTSISSLWCDLVDCKHFYYDSLAHCLIFQIYKQLFILSGGQTNTRVLDSHLSLFNKIYDDLFETTPERLLSTAKSHIRRSISSVEKALKTSKKHIKLHFAVQQPLRTLYERVSRESIKAEEFVEVSGESEPVPNIRGNPYRELKPIPPDFTKYKVEDLFKRLGSLSIFSSNHSWTKPREVSFDCTKCKEFGFTIRGDSPTIIASVDSRTPASETSMLVGDFIVAINNVDAKWTSHADVVNTLRSCNESILTLTIITPTDKNYIDPDAPGDAETSLGGGTTFDDRESFFSTTNGTCDYPASRYGTIDSSFSTWSTRSDLCRRSRIISISRCNSLSRTFQTSAVRPTRKDRKEITNYDNVVIIEQN